MLAYNTQLLPLRLSEYGRNIHQMIDFCVHIPDRDERTQCAMAIAHIMENLFPEYVADDGSSKKIWDHINIIADFKLDIDFPCEVADRDSIHTRPKKIAYNNRKIKHRIYGRTIQVMIEKVADMEDGPDKDDLISMIAHHMKKLMLVHNKEGVDDVRILRDLSEYSGGRINLDPNTYILHEFKELDLPEVTKKKKKN